MLNLITNVFKKNFNIIHNKMRIRLCECIFVGASVCVCACNNIIQNTELIFSESFIKNHNKKIILYIYIKTLIFRFGIKRKTAQFFIALRVTRKRVSTRIVSETLDYYIIRLKMHSGTE